MSDSTARITIDQIVTLTKGETDVIELRFDDLEQKLDGKPIDAFFDHVIRCAEALGSRVEIVKEYDVQAYFLHVEPDPNAKVNKKTRWQSNVPWYQILVYAMGGALWYQVGFWILHG